jgi:NAD+ diphosphatase
MVIGHRQTQTPVDAFNFCARCGSSAISSLDSRAIRCAQCHFELYVNSAAAAAVFIRFGQLLLLTVRGREPDRGKFDLPGGFIEFDESAETCARREVMEELNLSLGELTYLTSAPNDYFYGEVHYKTTDLFFVSAISEISAIVPRDDVSGFQLVDPTGFDAGQLAFPSTRFAFQRFKASLEGAESLEHSAASLP